MYIDKSTINFTNGKQFCGKTLDECKQNKDLVRNKIKHQKTYKIGKLVRKRTNIKFIWKDIKDLTPVRGQDGKISDTQGKHLYWSPTRLSYPAGVWDFSVLPSYQCLILFLTNFPILYVFWCLILFLTKSLFCLHALLPVLDPLYLFIWT
jgi:hypothetical protein